MTKVSIVSLGCPKNRVDSDTLREGLTVEGFLFTPEPEDSDIVFVNTCGFIEDAKKESIEEILRLKALKARGKKLLVFGCLAERYRDELLKEIPEIDALWGVSEFGKMVEYCKSVMNEGGRENGRCGRRPASKPPVADSYVYLKIAEGCDRGCTFCIIPSIRGPFRSSEPEGILRKAEEHLRAGAKELILVAQDIASFGKEFNGYGLPSLLRDIASISGDFRIRLLYLYPTSVGDELLSVIAEEAKVCKYLDIPLQHSEDRILAAMGRGGTRKWYKRQIGKIREAIPDVTLRTTFIVGFPGEADEDFRGLKDFVEEMRFDRLGVFTYSKEEGSAACRMKSNVPRRIKIRRRDEIMRIQSAISLEKNRELTGRKFRALVDDVDESVAIVRLCSQAPEIDGVTIIEKGQMTDRSSLSLRRGDFVDVEIVGAYDYDLKGKVVPRDGVGPRQALSAVEIRNRS